MRIFPDDFLALLRVFFFMEKVTPPLVCVGVKTIELYHIFMFFHKFACRIQVKLFRLEAVRAGFRKAWQEKDYPTIVAVAAKIPDSVLQENAKLLMWYDQALTRMEDH